MSALFDLSSLLTVLLLGVCTCTYIRELRPAIFDPPPSQDGSPLKREGFMGFFWKLSRIGERMSPYVGICCALMAIHGLFFK